MSPEEILICRIFEQAIEDYKDLKKQKITQVEDNTVGSYSIKDIESFFGSKWCVRLLDIIGCRLTGKDILGKIQTQCT